MLKVGKHLQTNVFQKTSFQREKQGQTKQSKKFETKPKSECKGKLHSGVR